MWHRHSCLCSRAAARPVERQPVRLPGMSCDHIGPTELIEMAEKYLHEHALAPANGMRFRWSENPVDGMWASIVTEIERREGQWIVTRLHRNREALPDGETGF